MTATPQTTTPPPPSTNRPPRRSWEQMVQELNRTQEPRQFMAQLLELHAKLVAAEYGAIWAPGQGQGSSGEGAEAPAPRLIAAWPEALAQSPDGSPAKKLLAQAAAAGFSKQVSHVLRLEAADANGPSTSSATTTRGGPHVYVTPIRSGDQIAAVSTVVAEVHDPAVIAATMPGRALSAGLFEGLAARAQLREAAAESSRIRESIALLGACQEAEGFKGAAMTLVNELVRTLKCERVSLGWVHGESVRLVAMSDTEQLKRHSEAAQRLELAMCEAMDQQQPLICPIPDDAEPLLAQGVIHAHRELQSESGVAHTLSVPLRSGEDWKGVLTLERAEPFDAGMIRRLQLVADVIAPQLADRRESDQWLVGHAWRSLRWSASWAVGPRHTPWKMLAVAVIALVVASFLITWPLQVSAPVTVEPGVQQTASAPFDNARLIEVLVEQGDEVEPGQLLARLDVAELWPQLREAQESMRAAEINKQNLLNQRKMAEYAEAEAQRRQAEARVELLRYRIARSEIRAPIAGVVLEGLEQDRLGDELRRGDPMYRIAPIDELVAIVKVDEADVDLIDAAADQGRVVAGRMATRGRPLDRFEIEMIRLAPQAVVEDGGNRFELRTRIEEPAEWLRPGMEGMAKIDVGERSLAYLATHRLLDWFRLYFWW